MIGIIVNCHRKMATEIKEVVANIFGKLEFFEAIEVFSADGKEGTIAKVKNIITSEAWQKLDGTLIFVDMFGGTPANASAIFLKESDNIDIVSGVNLTMILKALNSRDNCSNFKNFVDEIILDGQKSILSVKKLIFRG